MNAPIAPPSAITPKTSNTAIAITANSPQVLTIDGFIKQQFAKADSVNGSGVVESSKRVAALGFTSAANLRYAAFLEAFRSTPHLTERYAERYPLCYFLPWRAFHNVMASLDLWCDLPRNYTGAVPEGQLPYMEMFELQGEDRIGAEELISLLNEPENQAWQAIAERILHAKEQCGYKYMDDKTLNSVEYVERDLSRRGRVCNMWQQVVSSFFVVAPKEAFKTRHDFLTRFCNLLEEVGKENIAPNDPLVVRFVPGGALVVAAWGDEAAFINEATRELKL